MKQAVFTFILLTIGSYSASQTPGVAQFCSKVAWELSSVKHPRVVFDEAHYNKSGFQPLAELVASMGFEVEKSQQRLNLDILSTYDVLIIAGARPTDIHNTVAISPDGKMIASGGEKQTIKLWDLETGKLLNILQNKAWVGQLVFGIEGRTLAVSGSDGRISIWDVTKGRERTLDRQSGISRALVFSPDGTTIATGHDNGSIQLFDSKTGQLRVKLKGHSGVVNSLAFSPDGRTLASGGADLTIKLWRVTTGNIQTTLPKRSGEVRCLEFSPDGKTLVAAGDMNDVELWDIERGRLHRLLEGHSGVVYSVAFTPDGRMLATGGTDDVIIIWDMETGLAERVLDEHEDWIISLAFSPDGKSLAAVDDDEVIKLWKISNGNVELNLTGREDLQWDSGPAFTEKECDAVLNWVRSGGGLLLLTDHAPWGAAAKNLASRFGVSLSNSNGTEDPLHHDPDGNNGMLVFSRENGLLGDHAITRGRHPGERVDRVVTYYGNSLIGPAGSTSLLTLSSTSVDLFKDNERVSAKGRSQGVVAKYGNGRIVVFGEMGMFMADAVNLSGLHGEIGLNRTDYDNRQLAINVIRWLAKRIN